MRALLICLVLFMAVLRSLPTRTRTQRKFSPGPASSYPAKQTNDHVTVAAVAYDTEELAHTAFGKLNPNQYGVLPVLVIIQNDTDQALKLEHLDVEYTEIDGQRVEATPAGRSADAGWHRRGRTCRWPRPYPSIGSTKTRWMCGKSTARSFAAKLLPPHESANGFFYFQTTHRPGSKFYLSGVKVAATGQDVFYFEIPLEIRSKPLPHGRGSVRT